MACQGARRNGPDSGRGQEARQFTELLVPR